MPARASVSATGAPPAPEPTIATSNSSNSASVVRFALARHRDRERVPDGCVAIAAVVRMPEITFEREAERRFERARRIERGSRAVALRGVGDELGERCVRSLLRE